MNRVEKKPATKADKTINAIIVLIILAFVAVGVYATYGKIAEGIKDRAIENGEAEATVAYLAKQENMSVEDYLAQYGLSVGDTITEKSTQSEMVDNMTLENYGKYVGQDAQEMIDGTNLQDKVTKDTLWKDFLPLIPSVSYYGEEQFNKLKEVYGLGDEVTPETPYGELQKILEEKQAQMADEASSSEGENQSADGGSENAAE